MKRQCTFNENRSKFIFLGVIGRWGVSPAKFNVWPDFMIYSGGIVAKGLTRGTLDLEVRGSSLARRIVSLDKELYSTLFLFSSLYKWVPVTYCWGVTP